MKMPVTFESIENGRVCILTATHPWAIAEFMAFYPELKNHLDTAPEKIHLLFDFSEAGMWKGNAFQARNAPFTGHRNMGFLAVITNSTIIEVVAEAMIRIGRTDYTHFFKTKAEGLAFLRSKLTISANT
jgi:hypothetical protein